jgi:outer membrane protein assembly factor BamB
MLFVAGNPGSNTGIVAAYNSATGNPTPVWSNASLTYAATSSPVVSDSEGLVYVQSGPNYDPLHGGTWTGQLIYALDQSTGINNWMALPASIPSLPAQPSPCSIGYYHYASGGSPAYDDSNKFVVASTSVTYATVCGTTAAGSLLAVYNAHRLNQGGGTLLCSANTSHPIINSSPEVVNGVIYVGTDDGYILAYDETQCSSGALPLITTLGPMDSGLEGPPVVSFNRVHAVSQKGTLYIWHRPGW